MQSAAVKLSVSLFAVLELLRRAGPDVEGTTRTE